MSGSRSFEENTVTVGATALFLGGAFAAAGYLVLARGTPPGTAIDPAAASTLGWVAIVATGVLFVLSLVRLGARHRVVLEADRVRFGVGARFHVRRDQVAGVDRIGRAVELRLRDPHDPDVRAAAGLHGNTEVVHLEVARYRDGRALPSAVATWYADAP